MSRAFDRRPTGEKTGVGRPLRSLLERPVVLNGIELGFATDALVELETLRVVGFDVACGDDAVRFLPLGAARVVPGALEIDSPLILLEEDDQAFYRRRGRAFRELVGTIVEARDGVAGALVDICLDDEGSVSAVQVETPIGTRELPAAAGLVLGGVPSESAA